MTKVGNCEPKYEDSHRPPLILLCPLCGLLPDLYNRYMIDIVDGLV